MKRNDIKALKEKTDAQLTKQLSGLEIELAKARLEKKAMKLDNTTLPRTLADDIARVKTELRRRELLNK
ncbi:MAG: 50S ribosomal protein L29 [Candidatus Pacebacteria bacterium]|nr:50S ribosomal protein L29 [Candidatus Paceibacterota bacterium]